MRGMSGRQEPNNTLMFGVTAAAGIELEAIR